ncbi:MAG TPA: YeeE/YedE family protein [Stellaceae bacterium]|nr:YeeE/YedE family protein [Stellaceae bacterium]
MAARSFVSLAAGFLFGLGLTISRMIDPAKVLGFLDVAGNWDPSLAFVMGGAVAVAAIGYRLAGARPVLDAGFHGAVRRSVDRPLVAGAVIFGAGWGLVGYCPGPALASLGLGRSETLIFVVAMVAGMGVHRLYEMQAVTNLREKSEEV